MSGDIASYTFPFFTRARDESKPNVVVLFTDEQRYDTIAALGYPHMITPTLDRLVREGTTFTHACTPNPVCVAARHSLLTGLHSRHTGLFGNNHAVLPPAMPRIPQLLADNGYCCEVVGKMHFTPPRAHHGYHRLQLQEELPNFIDEDDYLPYLRQVGLGHIRNPHGVRNPLYHHPQRSQLPEEHHPATWVGDHAADAVRRHATRPFFLFASWIHPHPPVAVPDSYADLYTGRLPQPTPLEEDPNPYLRHARLERDCFTPESVQRFRELYHSAITLVDHNMAKVIAALEEIGQLDNTLIIMTSDHGDMLGDNGAYDKQLPNDPSVRIPMILRYPKRFEANVRRGDYADLVDLMPTILDVCGIPMPECYPYPGESLCIPQGGGIKDRTVHYMENGAGSGRRISLRGERYKINYFFGGGITEFYDMQSDPHELRNLVKLGMDTDTLAAFGQMLDQLVTYEAQYGHRDSLVDGKLAVRDLPPGESWPPNNYGIDWQMAKHAFNLPAEEEAKLNRHGDEMMAVVEKEPSIDLRRIDWDRYESSTRDFETRGKVCGELVKD